MERPLRIAFLDSWLARSSQGSGTAVGIRNLAATLRRLGQWVELLRPRTASPTLMDRATFNLRLPGRLRTRTDLDLVVGFDLDGFLWARAQARYGSPQDRVPYVVALKGIASDEARFSRSRRERWLLEGLARLERANAIRADRVLVPSRYSAEVAATLYGIPPERIGIVPEAVDLSLFRRVGQARRGPSTEHGAPQSGVRTNLSGEQNQHEPPLILTIARQYPRKDTATLLRAMPVVLSSHPNARLRVIGGGPELPRLRALMEELGLTASVTLHGEVERDTDVAQALREASVFCLPSLQEGFGIVFVEAMAAGLPVVAAKAGAVPEIVVDGVTGILVPPGDPSALGAALSRLLRDSEAREEMGRAGSALAEDYDLDVVGRRFLTEVRPLLRRPRRSSRSRTP